MKHLVNLLVALFGCTTAFAQKQDYKTAIVAFYNLENFYDTTDNPAVNDNDFTPGGDKNYNTAIYQSKVHHLATVIAQIGTEMNPDGPAILGVAEIENDTVLNDLVKDPLISSRKYNIVHYDSRDLRGVDVAFLYNPKYFTVEDSRKLFVRLPAGAKENIFTRDVLWVKGRLDGETIHVFVNHWPSRLGGEERSAPGRAAAAMVCKHFADSLQKAAPNAKIIIMGDLNDDPVNASLTKVLNAKGRKEEVKENGLFNPWVEMYKKGYGTLAYQDAWGLFDQIIISAAWLSKNQPGFFYLHQHIFNKQFLIENAGKYRGYPMRTWDGNTYRGGYSDHFPTYLVMVKKAQ
ncbi:endonuclease/exonuclease/phosphatase [Panacibacter sp. DH6]|uniref:Endonuclease/exonuclease/phosphatase n=1 Tax=Panacibacter microcysteis TaxID=2793269 RepID=A0A931E8U9_9BACT|nr:endonuclease/exonuclease/phosphatase [Panacibacter microcysteis]MBG9377273.1 endonuclease/exonuclease/phosphatase [Panacibacter microcysteis]